MKITILRKSRNYMALLTALLIGLAFTVSCTTEIEEITPPDGSEIPGAPDGETPDNPDNSDNPNGPDSPSEGNNKRLVLIYAIAANNLYYNLSLDVNEIYSIASELDLKNNTVLLYSVVPDGTCKLSELRYLGEENWPYRMVEVKGFPDTPLSTEPERISEVLDYVNSNYNHSKKGLILWSHATGWIPSFPPREVQSRSFGQDIYDNVSYTCNIDVLADAIPAGVFDFIWFDCCYMGNIETVYQLKDKTDYVVGYPTEIHENGMPYNLTMPYLLQQDADLNAAAYALFKYYDRQYIAVTVGVVETAKLPDLASAAYQIFENGVAPTNLSKFINYSRNKSHPFYDIGQLLRNYQDITDEERDNFNEALNNAVISKYASPRDFNYNPIDLEQYSGLSIHNYIDRNSNYDDFYRSLDWYKATR